VSFQLILTFQNKILDLQQNLFTYCRLYGYKDATEMLVKSYESESFTQEMADTWESLKPLYEQLHAYVRSKLYQK